MRIDRRTLLSSFAALALPATARAVVEAPHNPALGRGGWAVYHRNNYAQASTAARGPEPGDRLEAQVLEIPGHDVSPWTLLTAPYASGAQAAWGSSRFGVWKALLDGPRFALISSLLLPERARFDFDYGMVALADDTLITSIQKRNEFVLYGDLRRGDAESPIGELRRWKVPQSVGQLSTHFSLTWDGRIVFITREGRVGALDRASGEIATVPLRDDDGADLSTHNSFPLDEAGGVYVASQQSVTRLDWNGREFSRGWFTPIDLRGPGCPPQPRSRFREAIAVARGDTCTGSGTTPTLLGTPRDGVVVLVDGWSPQNRMIALWRGEPPRDWVGLPGYDRRVAAILPLPHSTPDGAGFTMENSPAAWGDALVCAQWNGLRPSCAPLPGVQKLRWDAPRRELALAWANDSVALNGVLTISGGSKLVYGCGRRDCEWRYSALDWQTGRLMIDLPLGNDDRFRDPGNQHVITADRSIVYGGVGGAGAHPACGVSAWDNSQREASQTAAGATAERPHWRKVRTAQSSVGANGSPR